MIKLNSLVIKSTREVPVPAWPPSGSWTMCARLYVNTSEDHICMNTVSWYFDGGSSYTYSDPNCNNYLDNLSQWNDGTEDTYLPISGQDSNGKYVNIFTNGEGGSVGNPWDFCVILANGRVNPISDDSWAITKVDIIAANSSTYYSYDNPNSPYQGEWLRDNDVSNWTQHQVSGGGSIVSTKFRSFGFKRTVPGSEVINHYSTQILSDEFGWLVPIQDILNNINNNFNITIYAYAYESEWEGGFYFAQPDDRGNFIRVCDYTRTYDGTSGLNTFNVSNQDLKAGINSQSYFLEDLLNRGYTNVFVHPAAFQYYKFNQDPTADFSYGIPASTIIRPITILENIPDPVYPFRTVQIGNQLWMAENMTINDGGEGIYTTSQMSYEMPLPMTYYTIEAANRIANNVSGWHLPTRNDYLTLVNYVGGIEVAGIKLKSTQYWYNGDPYYQGTDDYGFTALPCGYIYIDDAIHNNGINEESYLVTSTDTPYGDNSVYALWFQFYNQSCNLDIGLYKGDSNTEYYYTVRLIKD